MRNRNDTYPQKGEGHSAWYETEEVPGSVRPAYRSASLLTRSTGLCCFHPCTFEGKGICPPHASLKGPPLALLPLVGRRAFDSEIDRRCPGDLEGRAFRGYAYDSAKG